MKYFLCLVLLTFIVQSPSAQAWRDLLESKPESETPLYRQMMVDESVSWYDVEKEYDRYWLQMQRRPQKGEGTPEYRRYLDFMQSNSVENGYYRANNRNSKFWDLIRNTRSNQSQSRSVADSWIAIGPDQMDPLGDANNTRSHSASTESLTM